MKGSKEKKTKLNPVKYNQHDLHDQVIKIDPNLKPGHKNYNLMLFGMIDWVLVNKYNLEEEGAKVILKDKKDKLKRNSQPYSRVIGKEKTEKIFRYGLYGNQFALKDINWDEILKEEKNRKYIIDKTKYYKEYETEPAQRKRKYKKKITTDNINEQRNLGIDPIVKAGMQHPSNNLFEYSELDTSGRQYEWNFFTVRDGKKFPVEPPDSSVSYDKKAADSQWDFYSMENGEKKPVDAPDSWEKYNKNFGSI